MGDKLTSRAERNCMRLLTSLIEDRPCGLRLDISDIWSQIGIYWAPQIMRKFFLNYAN
jgi:hypothetical protein